MAKKVSDVYYTQSDINLMQLLASRHLSDARRDVLSSFGMSEAYWLVLVLIRQAEQTCVTKLSSILGTRTTFITVVLNSFEKDGLISRSQSLRDQRVYFVQLTDKGMSTFLDIDQALSKHRQLPQSLYPQLDSIVNSNSNSKKG